MDGSWGAHNPLYTQRILKEARRKLTEATHAAPTGAAAKEDTR